MKSTIKASTTIVLLIFSAHLAKAQVAEDSGAGIHFEQSNSWEQIKAKAKAEHKYIFVDCYATWCGPCKVMDQEVYPIKEVGDAMNAKFISVRVQMDQTVNDNDTIKAWYESAKAFTKDYSINSFPSFVFFDENGNAVHMAIGSLRPKNFIQLAADAQNPDKQYFTLLHAYQNGKRDYQHLPELVKLANNLDDKTIALQIGKAYMHDYLDHLSPDQFLTRDNLSFISNNPDIVVPSDRIFQLCFKQPAKVDTALHNKDFADGFVNRIINQHEVWPKTDQAKKTGVEPNWITIANNITKKYGHQYVDANLINAKYNWYVFEKDKPNSARYLTMIIEREVKKNGIPKDPFAQMMFNNNAWIIFQDDPDKKDLQQALEWMQQTDQSNSGDLDTEANLLYKLGRKNEAIAIETKAVSKSPNDKDIAENFRKMKSDEHTWPDKME